jgi:hypothetical protein
MLRTQKEDQVHNAAASTQAASYKAMNINTRLLHMRTMITIIHLRTLFTYFNPLISHTEKYICPNTCYTFLPKTGGLKSRHGF